MDFFSLAYIWLLLKYCRRVYIELVLNSAIVHRISHQITLAAVLYIHLYITKDISLRIPLYFTCLYCWILTLIKVIILIFVIGNNPKLIHIHHSVSSPLNTRQSYANLKTFLNHLTVSNFSKKNQTTTKNSSWKRLLKSQYNLEDT